MILNNINERLLLDIFMNSFFDLNIAQIRAQFNYESAKIKAAFTRLVSSIKAEWYVEKNNTIF